MELRYAGVEMRPMPVQLQGWGLTLETFDDLKLIKKTVLWNIPVAVALEPGDGTRYDLTLVQVYGDRYVTVVYRQQARSAEITPDRPIHPWDVETISSNIWSRQLLAWWLTLVFDK